METIKAKWRQMIRQGLKNGPSIIVFDDLDLLCPAEQELVRSTNVADVLLDATTHPIYSKWRVIRGDRF